MLSVLVNSPPCSSLALTGQPMRSAGHLADPQGLRWGGGVAPSARQLEPTLWDLPLPSAPSLPPPPSLSELGAALRGVTVHAKCGRAHTHAAQACAGQR